MPKDERVSIAESCDVCGKPFVQGDLCVAANVGFAFQDNREEQEVYKDMGLPLTPVFSIPDNSKEGEEPYYMVGHRDCLFSDKACRRHADTLSRLVSNVR